MTLATPHRRLLETAIKRARSIATGGAGKSLEALAVHEPDPYRHMDEAQRKLRVKLRAQAKQLGDGESHAKRGSYEIKHLVEKLAYDQWHRLLFARYLLENNLLISPEHGVSVSLDDCEELAPSLMLKDAWAVAARFAAVELPEIFRADDPAGAVELPVEDRKPLIQLVIDLPVEVFTASDSLGWCYQFWQADTKEAVNKSGNKIGADELPSVTQLFTEDYMVDFLLDNTLGAWWAGKKVISGQLSVISCPTEEDARAAVALPGCPWKYLRFVRVSSSSTDNRSLITDCWSPAAGTFEGWPKTAKELKCLDPCMGSGHFEVAMFERLVALRMAEENLDEAAAVAVVIRDNLFGLEIDPRCTQIAAFNLALAAWRRVGHCKLPAMNLACSGLAPNTPEKDWVSLAGDNDRLQRGMARLYALFKNAPILGSLINPKADKSDLLEAGYHEVIDLLSQALSQESPSSFILQPSTLESAVTARGLAKAAEILAGQFTLVATNVPYLGRNKHDDVLKDYSERVYPRSKADLATCFVERCVEFCAPKGSTALVTPQNWLFLTGYRSLRESLLGSFSWNALARLEDQAFQTISGGVVRVVLLTITRESPHRAQNFLGLDASEPSSGPAKAEMLREGNHISISQSGQAANPDARITLGSTNGGALLSAVAEASHGQGTFDSFRFTLCFWEVDKIHNGWVLQQSTPDITQFYGGCYYVLRWEDGKGQLAELMACKEAEGYSSGKWKAGVAQWGKLGVMIGQMRELPTCLYLGVAFDENAAAVIPANHKMLPAIWAYCESGQFSEAAREIDQSLKITCKTLVKVPFDLAHWQKVAAEKYPHGLPKPFSSDATQWLFNGHPAGADQPLHVAVARLLGYQWPRQTGSSFPDCPALGPDGLEKLADADGIVCLSATKGEAPGAERLRALLAQALGKLDISALLASAGPGGKKGSKSQTLDDWLRDEFFEQHCDIFHHRPFIWHIWDGHKSGFSALVNYHKLKHANLESLTFAYLGDWIRRQQSAVDTGEAGSDARLQAAKQLQIKLKLILEGEPPHDIFVRWKELSQQAIGWQPDLNDGVRMNIRPFATADILRKRVKIKWEKDRGKEPQRDKAEFPWFWHGGTFTGDRINDVHLTIRVKKGATP